MSTLTTYTVTYNLNSGSGNFPSQIKTHGISLTLYSTTPTRTGHTFVRWSGSNGSTYNAGSSYTGNSNLTLTAVWQATTYTVSYNLNGGSGNFSSQTKTHGVSLTLYSTTPTRSGYTFQGWATSSGSTQTAYVAGQSYTSNSDLNLFAIWQAIYTVTYNLNSGSGNFSSQTKTHGVSLTLYSTTPDRKSVV